MQDGWSGVMTDAPFGGYVAWEDAHPRPSTPDLRPVFLHLAAPEAGTLTLAQALVALQEVPGLVLSTEERRLLQCEAGADGTLWPDDLRVVAHLPRASLNQLPGFARIGHVASASAAPDLSDPGTFPLRERQTDGATAGPAVIAVIDDGIAYLNSRFRASPTETRLTDLWLQSERSKGGLVLGPTEINGRLQSGRDEVSVYRDDMARIGEPSDRNPTMRRVAHGTHVLDLAAGADPWRDDPILAHPLMAVALPPATVEDTSGRRNEAHVAIGLRWLLNRMLARPKDGPLAPLIVNLSLGSLAGPGDASAFLADWIDAEIRRYRRLAPGAVLRLVAAYGNAYRGRLVGLGEVSRDRPFALDWRILPDDRTASFLEVRAPANADSLRLRLTPPGSGPVLDTRWPDPGERLCLGRPLCAQVSGAAEPGRRVLHLALAANAGRDARAGMVGAWRVEVMSDDATPVAVSAKVERDDTPAGMRPQGRQSWLDHPTGWTWDSDRAAMTGAADPIARNGTAVDFAGLTSPEVYFVGAARADGRPTLYTAAGSRDASLGAVSAAPALAARAESGSFLPGLRAAGVRSGAVGRIAGTSVAAPCVARALAVYFRKGGGTDRAAELLGLTGKEPPETADTRLGAGLLQEV
jgi:hypothetical protein